MAETLNEAAVLGLKAMNVPGERLHLLSLDVLVKSPQVYLTQFPALCTVLDSTCELPAIRIVNDIPSRGVFACLLSG
jgi:hypothetical protein